MLTVTKNNLKEVSAGKNCGRGELEKLVDLDKFIELLSTLGMCLCNFNKASH